MNQASPFDRRRFLRGLGVTLALPWFESLATSSASGNTITGNTISGSGVSGSAANGPPLRSAFIYFPNGVWEKGWVPSEEGEAFALTPALEPLSDMRQHCTVLTGLDKKHSHGGDGHYAKTANFLTGCLYPRQPARTLAVAVFLSTS
jgi:hypothetical protein